MRKTTTAKPLACSLAVLAAAAVLPAAARADTDNAWYQAGQAEIQAKLARQPITARAKNVILFVADGNGVSTNYATRIFQGQRNGGYGDENVMAKEALPYLALSKTYNTNAQTPDSAGTAVAFMTGIKTKSGVIGVDETLRRGECADVEAARIDSIGDVAAEMGKSVGIVTTARVTHATPSAVYAHAANRDFEADSDLPEGCEVPDIAVQLAENIQSGTVDLAMGGGRRAFVPADFEDDEGKAGKRNDGRNLVDELRQAGVQYVWNDETLAGLNMDYSAPLLALFESSHMFYEHDRAGEPSIVQMTEAAIDYLSHNDQGYFLLVEGGRVDHGNHDGNAYRALSDGVAFDEAIARAVELTDEQDTLIVVTADHGHAMSFNGYCGRGSPIEGLCHQIDDAGEKYIEEPNLADDGKPYTAIGYMNGVGSVLVRQADGSYFGTRPILTQEEATDPDFVQQAMLPLPSETHSPADVAIYARGPWAHLFDGTVEQSYIYHVMRHAFEAE
ncbi:alkaline phosphatase [Tropicimonas sp.]|uniref:alkaline phosphatase n=1 Tax=Tropicimonas sp. TaxID=2067044 RepID=UPI003A85E9B1